MAARQASLAATRLIGSASCDTSHGVAHLEEDKADLVAVKGTLQQEMQPVKAASAAQSLHACSIGASACKPQHGLTCLYPATALRIKLTLMRKAIEG